MPLPTQTTAGGSPSGSRGGAGDGIPANNPLGASQSGTPTAYTPLAVGVPFISDDTELSSDLPQYPRNDRANADRLAGSVDHSFHDLLTSAEAQHDHD